MKKLIKYVIIFGVTISILIMVYMLTDKSSIGTINRFVKASVANHVFLPDRSREINNISNEFNNVENGNSKPVSDKPKSFIETVRSRASTDNVIILAYFDFPFLDSAINFYETSLKPFGLNNFVFTVSEKRCCDALSSLGPDNCFVYRQDPASHVASQYGNEDFKRKMNIRTDMILDCLKAGFTVLHSDIDVYFTKNPFDFINCKDCDIAALMDTTDYNAGFLYIRPTTGSEQVYQRMKQIAAASPHIDDQDQLTHAIGEMYSKLKVVKLPEDKFLCGLYYYENAHRNFVGDNPCSTCVVVHNNWIVSMEAKEYRCKETGMWNYDKDGYYSSTSRKYLLYENPYKFENNDVTHREEHGALQAAIAIAMILNRTLILPAFHCDSNLCSMINYYRISSLDKTFKNLYRESVFLKHPKVPEAIQKSKSETFLIVSDQAVQFVTKYQQKLPDNVKQVMPKDRTNGASSQEVLSWWGSEQASILLLHSLYHSFSKFDDVNEQNLFISKIGEGLKGAGYRQF